MFNEGNKTLDPIAQRIYAITKGQDFTKFTNVTWQKYFYLFKTITEAKEQEDKPSFESSGYESVDDILKDITELKGKCERQEKALKLLDQNITPYGQATNWNIIQEGLGRTELGRERDKAIQLLREVLDHSVIRGLKVRIEEFLRTIS
jgi:hypothetical protein